MLIPALGGSPFPSGSTAGRRSLFSKYKTFLWDFGFWREPPSPVRSNAQFPLASPGSTDWLVHATDPVHQQLRLPRLEARRGSDEWPRQTLLLLFATQKY